MTRKVILWTLISLIIICSFSGCTEESVQPQTLLQKSLEPFLNALEDDNLNGMTLKIYAIGEVLTRAHSAEELIEGAKKNDDIYTEVTIDNATLKEYITTLSQIRAENFEVADGLKRENARACFVFETEEKLLEIVVGGRSKEPYAFEGFGGTEISLTVFINGIEVKINNTLHQIMETLYSLQDTAQNSTN